MLILPDSEIHALIIESKTIPDGLCPLTRQIERNHHRRREFEVAGASGNSFMLSTRQSMLNVVDFSVILGYKMPGINTIFRLCRYNGKSHHHTNTIEKDRFRDFHKHTATERYQRIGGLKEDHFAEIDNRYWNLESAVRCLLEDCGFQSPMADSPLFSGRVQ
jgi:hypothetical protein